MALPFCIYFPNCMNLLSLSKKSTRPISIIFTPLKINNLQATENRKIPRFRVFRQARYISFGKRRARPYNHKYVPFRRFKQRIYMSSIYKFMNAPEAPTGLTHDPCSPAKRRRNTTILIRLKIRKSRKNLARGSYSRA